MSSGMSSVEYCESIVKALFDLGINEFCVASGSRNGALLLALSQAPVRKYMFIDERSAAFFALGRIKKTGRAVAVVCTSGTAAAELLPATVEAHYSCLPLVLVTCDRPRDYRGTGAPQSIEQVGLYSKYVEKCWDLTAEDAIPQKFFSGLAPVQINLALQEEDLGDRDTALFWGQQPAFRTDPLPPGDDIASVQKFLADTKNPLVVLSELAPQEIEPVAAFLENLGAPIFAEATSNLRERLELSHLMLSSGERLLAEQSWDAVIRVGGVPTTRYWRDLDSSHAQIPVLHMSSRPFKGLRRGLYWSRLDVSSLSKLELPELKRNEAIFAEDHRRSLEVKKLYDRFPQAEPSLVHALSLRIPGDSQIFLGNSLPIREWDLFATREVRSRRVYASRGANGIDGQVSTFLGLAAESRQPTYAILGDMTALYDSGAMWIERQVKGAGYGLIVMNNGGGKIFSRVKSLKGAPTPFMQQYLHQKHDFDFSKLALMWDLPFSSWQSIPDEIEPADRTLIEIRPDEAETDAFWRTYARVSAKAAE